MRASTYHNPRADSRSLSICCPLGIGVLAAIFLPLLANARILEFELKPLWSAEFAGVNPADIDRDGFDELLISREGKNPQRWGISLTKADLSVLWQYWSNDRTEGLSAVDINGDSKLEILARERVGDTAFLLIFSASGELLERIKAAEGKDLDPPSGWDGNIGFKGLLDVDGDGRNELLLSVASYFDLQPRGFFALDPRTGRQLWYYPVGFAPGSVATADLDGDGDLETVLGSFSPANGSQANGTDDLHTYVAVLDHEGRLLWQSQIGGHFSATIVKIADFNKDSIQEIVVSEKTERGEYLGPDKLMILDGPTGDIKRVIKTGHAYRGLLLCDLDRDDIPEIVVGNSDGVVRAFNAELEEVSRFEYTGEVKVTDVGDLNGDGHPEVLASALDGTVFILDDELKESNRYQAGEGYRVSAQLVDWGRRKRLLLCMVEPDGRVGFAMLEVSRKLTAPSKLSLAIFLPFIALLILIIVLVLFLYYRRGVLIRGIISDPGQGILFITRDGRIAGINGKARSMLGVEVGFQPYTKLVKLKVPAENEPIKKTIVESIEKRSANRKLVTSMQSGEECRIEVDVRPLGRLGWIARARDVSQQEFGRQVSAWIPVAQQLAHGIKNPLSHIRLAIQRLERFILEDRGKKKEATRYLKIVSDEVERLIKLTDGFMRFTKLEPPRRKPVAIEQAIGELLERIKPTVPRNIEIVVDLAPNLPEIKLDRDQISTVFDHLLDNALTAVGKRGKITIKAAFIETLNHKGKAVPTIEIRVSDTGPGIPPEYLSKVFEPYFSLKQAGTGLGLTMVRRIVEEHGGTITLDSVEGLGTTFILTLPLDGGESDR